MKRFTGYSFDLDPTSEVERLEVQNAPTCHPEGVVAEQRVAQGESARVNSGVLVRHINDAQHPLAQPRSVVRHKSSTVLEPDDGL